MKNTQVKLIARPNGRPQTSDFEIIEENLPELNDGEVLVRIIYISMDPAMRGWMNQSRSYVPPVRLGQVMRAGTVGQVVDSKDAGFAKGDYVTGMGGVQNFHKAKAADLEKIDAKLAPLPRFLGVLGMPGMTAYFGLLDVGALNPGDNVVVSGAAGAVGSMVGQIAKIKDCNVIGIAGGPSKCQYITDELGFDKAIDYKTGDVAMSIKREFKKGLNVYFDNVGGDILEAALFNLARGARVVICGAISQYNNEDGGAAGPRNYLSLLVNRGRMEGFVVFDYADRYAEARTEIAGWLADGRLQAKEQIEQGVENYLPVLMKLFDGQNTGKLILQAGPED